MKKHFYIFISFVFAVCFTSAQTASPLIKIETSEVYRERIASLKSGVELIYRDEIKNHIDQYLANPEMTKQIIIRSKKYFPIIEKQLKQKNLPLDLKYLAVAASGLDPTKTGPSGESGMWMMMYNVSKMYKGKINSYIDERKDPLVSSNIAVSHLKDLHAIYYQWPLAITAYAVSPFMLNKTIRRAENSLYFWDIYPLLPEGARDLYPRMIAAMYIFTYHQEHGIKLPVFADATKQEIDSVRINKWLSFQQISAVIELPVDDIRMLNPKFKRDVVPFAAEGYWLYIPKNKLLAFDRLKDSVYNPHPGVDLYDPIVVEKDSELLVQRPIAAKPQPPAFDKVKVFYTVKKGDNLAEIAKWYDVSVNDIKSWNNLKSTTIYAGQKLTVWVKSSKSGYYKRINTMTRAEKNRLK
jgi:membrane-bound lytic murein transglycosylase D